MEQVPLAFLQDTFREEPTLSAKLYMKFLASSRKNLDLMFKLLLKSVS